MEISNNWENLDWTSQSHYLIENLDKFPKNKKEKIILHYDLVALLQLQYLQCP